MTDAYGANLGSAHGEVVIDVDKAVKNLNQLQNTTKGLDSALSQSLKKSDMASKAMLAIGAGVIAAGALSFRTAANFEQAISNVGAVANATDAEMEALRAKALQIGKDTSFSATQGALALEELIKAGVSVEAALGGAADGAVALAAASGTSLPNAAVLISNTLNQFELGADQAVHVADLLAAAANASAASADGLGEALTNVGTRAQDLGIPVEDVTTALAIMAQAGIEGGRAGTLLSSALGNLATPTSDGALALEEIGVSAYDANNQLKPFPQLVDELNTALSGLDQKSRNEILNRIFDEQGAKAIGPLLDAQSDSAEAAGKSWQDYYDIVTTPGAAADTAAKRLDNFNGSLEQLRGTIETIQIDIGTNFLPMMRGLVDGLTAVLNGFLNLSDRSRRVITAIVGLSGAVLGLVGAIGFAAPHVQQMASSFKALSTALRLMLFANPLLIALAAAIAIFAVAYKTNFGGFGDLVDRFAKSIRKLVDTFLLMYSTFKLTRGVIEGAFASLGAAFGQMVDPKLGDRYRKVFGAFEKIGRQAGKFGRGFRVIADELSTISGIIKRDGLGAGFEALFGTQGQRMLRGFGMVLGSVPRTVGTALTTLDTRFKNLNLIASGVGRSLQNVGLAITDIAKGNFRDAFDRIVQGALDLGGAVHTIGDVLIDGTPKLVGKLGDMAGDLWEWIKSQILGTKTVVDGPGAGSHQEANGGLLDMGTLLIDGALDLGGKLLTVSQDFAGWLKGKLTAGYDAAKGLDIPSVLISVGDFVVSSSAGIYNAVKDTVVAAWDFVKGTAIDLYDATLNLLDWLIPSIEDGSLVTNVKSAIENALSGIGIDITDWTITVGDPGEDSVTVDTKAIFGRIWDALTVPLVVDEENKSKANDLGKKIGEQFGGWLVDGIKSFFGVGQSGNGGEQADSGKVGIDAVAASFMGGLLSGLNKGIDQALTDWLGEPSDVADRIGKWWQGIVDSVVTGITGGMKDVHLGGGFGTGADIQIADFGYVDKAINSAVDHIKELFDFDISLPTFDLGGWIDSQLQPLRDALNKEWLHKLADGDLLGAAKALFGGSDSGSSTGGSTTHTDQEDVWGDFDKDGKPDNLDPDPNDPNKFGNFEKLGGAAADASTGLSSFAKAVDTAKASQDKFTPGLQQVARQAMPQFGAAGTQGGQEFAQGITGGFQRALAATASGVATIRAMMASLTNQYSLGFYVGVSFGQGIAAGLNSTIQSVAAGAANLVTTALNAARQAGGIHSPSKKARDLVGQPIGEGTALGVLDLIPAVKSASQKLVDSAMISSGQASTLGLNTSRGSVPSGQSSSGGGGGMSIVNIYALDSASLSKVLEGAEAGRYSKQAILGVPGAVASARGS